MEQPETDVDPRSQVTHTFDIPADLLQEAKVVKSRVWREQMWGTVFNSPVTRVFGERAMQDAKTATEGRRYSVLNDFRGEVARMKASQAGTILHADIESYGDFGQSMMIKRPGSDAWERVTQPVVIGGDGFTPTDYLVMAGDSHEGDL